MIAEKPKHLSHIGSASVPVIAVTAWQMLFEYARVREGQRILILGAAGNVGGYAVQLASKKGLNITATASSEDIEYVRTRGADTVLDYRTQSLEDVVDPWTRSLTLWEETLGNVHSPW